MKEHGQKCFPPSYEIMKFYLTRYHAHLKEVVSVVVVVVDMQCANFDGLFLASEKIGRHFSGRLICCSCFLL